MIHTPIVRFVFFVLLFIVCLPVAAQGDLSDSSWVADLRFLQRTVHEDYPFLFKKTTPEEFDDRIDGLIGSMGGMKPVELTVGLAKIISSFGYGHTHFWLYGEDIGFSRLPMHLYEFSDGVFVEGVHQDYARALGAKILRIDGVDIESAKKAIRPVVPAENEQFFLAHGLDYLTIPAIMYTQRFTEYLNAEVVLSLEKEGETFEMTVPVYPDATIPTAYGFTRPEGEWLSLRDQSTTPHYLRELDKHYYFDYLPDTKTVYVRYSQVEADPSESIPDFFERVFTFVEDNEVEKLVLDVRLNGGGNNYNNKAVITRIIESEKINQVGKLFVIIGRRTFSACQNLVNELDNYTNAIFVGEPTGENVNFYGDNRQLMLPNTQLPVYLSWAWWQDKPQWENAEWTAPHLPVAMSAEAYRSNQDPVLQRALTFKADNFLLDPMQHITNLFLAGKMDEVERETKRIAADPNYRSYDLLGKLNQAGEMLLQNERLFEARMVFEMNTRVYPESAVSFENLAKVYAKEGNEEQAKASRARAKELLENRD